jgi:AraC-like DNA-binding protein
VKCAPTPETLRAFRARFGGAFKSYVTRRLLEAAERLVDEPEVDLGEIEQALGFTDADLFRRWFKRWTGKTPETRRLALRPRPPATREPPAPTERPPISLWFLARVTALRRHEITRLIAFIRARCGCQALEDAAGGLPASASPEVRGKGQMSFPWHPEADAG